MIFMVARHTVRVGMAVVGILLILLALFTLSARVGLPLLAGYKSSMEVRVSDYLKSPVEIGELSLRWEGFGASLHARDVAVLESAERRVTLDELLIDLNLAKSLLRGIPIINELTLVGARLVIESDAQGRWRLHGMESVDNGAASVQRTGPGVNIVAWLLNASKVGLLDTEVSFIDGRAGRTVVVDDLNIRAENDGDVHQLRVEVNLSDQLGGTLEAGIDLVEQNGSLARSDGDLYLRVDQLELKTLSELLSVGGVLERERNVLSHIDAGVSLELWGRWEDGRLVSANGPLSTGNIIDTATGETLLTEVSAMLDVVMEADTSTMTARDVVLSAPGGDTRVDSLSFDWMRSRLDSRTSVTTAAEDAGLSAANGTAPDDTFGSWTLQADGDQLALETVSAVPASLFRQWHPQLAKHLAQAQASGWLRDWQLRLESRGLEQRALDHPGVDDQTIGNEAAEFGVFAKRPSETWATVPVVSFSAVLDQVQVAPVGSLPGLGPFDGRVNLVDSQGEVTLSATAMNLPWPSFTSRALNADELKAAITLDARDTQRVQVGADVSLTDQGIHSSTRLKATLVPGQSPHLDGQSNFSVADLNALKGWLPRSRMNAGLVRWLDRAIQGGKASNGSLLFFGRLEEFPFHEGEGVFRASVDIADGRLSFLPSWPTATGIDGTLELNGLMLTGVSGSARLENFDISRTAVRINDLNAPVLQLEGTGSGQLQDVLDFGNEGPLSDFLNPVLMDVTGSGVTSMDLGLSVQLYRDRQATPVAGETLPSRPFTVDGSLFLKGNTVAFARAGLALDTVDGAIGFDRNGIRINNLQARALEQPVLIKASTEGLGRQATTRVSVSGSLKGSDILAHYGIPLDQFLRGTSNWRININAPHSAQRMITEGVGLHVESDLVGTELLIPEPYRKGTVKAGAIELDTAFRTGQPAAQWQVRYADSLHASAWFGGETLESLLIHVGPGSLPQSLIDSRPEGIRVQGAAGTVAIDGWIESIDALIESLPQSDAGPSPIQPVSAELAIESLQVGSRLLGPASLRMNTDPTYVNTVLQNAFVNGSLRYPREHWSKETAVKARIAHLDSAVLDALASRGEATRLIPTRGEIDPRLLPPIDARISALVQDTHTLHDLVLRTEPDVSGLTVSTLGFAYQTLQLVGRGYWRLRDPQGINPALADQHQSQLSFVLQGDDFGEGLRHIGVEDVLSDGEGTVEAQFGWPGPLYRPRIAELDGSVRMQLERGSIIPLEPGAGRMVGLFALQALPRRLELDFKDMTADGLAFKRITGDLTIDDGIADVSLVQLTGPIGVIDITGKSDLNRREFDQQITVLPRVSAALPIIGVLSGGASAGIGALVATGFLKALGIDLDRLGLRDYSLTGKWDEPVFKVIEPAYRRRR